MKFKILIILFITFLTSCTSDKTVKTEKEELLGIFKNVIMKVQSSNSKITKPSVFPNTKEWLGKFNQPIILISSTDKNNQATLVALGNNDEHLTWVSADGLSLSYDSGILIATRGYSQDLLSLKYEKPSKLFKSKYIQYNKTHRYLNGENRYDDIRFICTGKKLTLLSTEIVEYVLLVDRYVESCVSKRYKYKNQYDLLSGTEVVIKSKQWISPTNGYFLTYNLYAFQSFQ